MQQTLTVPNPASATLIAEAIRPLLGNHSVVCFHGELGAGKTTFIKAICRDMGVTAATASPTFSIVNEYESSGGSPIYHFDLYRLKNDTELLDIGWEDYLQSGHLVFVEWPEMAATLMPDDALHLHIQPNADGSRTITFNYPKLPEP